MFLGHFGSRIPNIKYFYGEGLIPSLLEGEVLSSLVSYYNEYSLAPGY